MIREWTILEPPQAPKSAIVGLAGRGMDNEMMTKVCVEMRMPSTLIVCLRPWQYAWYPAPTSAEDQVEALAGIDPAVAEIEKRLDRIRVAYGLTNDKIILSGFSAGGVMAIQTALKAENAYHAVVAYSAAILAPDAVPKNNGKNTKFVLQHNRDDECFEWHERYLPMRAALHDSGYHLATIENHRGGHNISIYDVVQVTNFLRKGFGYEDTKHPESADYDHGTITEYLPK